MLQDEDNHLHLHNIPKGCLTSVWSNSANQLLGNFETPPRNLCRLQLNSKCGRNILSAEKPLSQSIKGSFLSEKPRIKPTKR